MWFSIVNNLAYCVILNPLGSLLICRILQTSLNRIVNQRCVTFLERLQKVYINLVFLDTKQNCLLFSEKMFTAKVQHCLFVKRWDLLYIKKMHPACIVFEVHHSHCLFLHQVGVTQCNYSSFFNTVETHTHTRMRPHTYNSLGLLMVRSLRITPTSRTKTKTWPTTPVHTIHCSSSQTGG